MKYDTSETGWNTILRDYTADLLEKFILEWRPTGGPFELTSKEAFMYELEQLKKQDRTISRASIIFALDRMVDMGLLTYRSKTGKGGYHSVYRLAKTPRELEKFVVAKFLQSVRDTWPDAYDQVVKAEE